MTAILVSTPSSKRKKRRIRFHERVQFKTIRHVSEFTDDEIRNGWYDKDDFNRMSENVSEIAQLIADGETTLDGEILCTRGLEHIVEEELADYRAEKMINSIDAVLDEQEEQWDEGKEEPGLIAELYAEYAKPLLKEAHLIGLKDAEQGYKSWDDLLEEEDYKKLKRKSAGSPRSKEKAIKEGQFQSPPRTTKDVVTPSSFANKSKVKKNKVKMSDQIAKQYIAPVKSPEKEKKVKKSKDKARTSPKKWNSTTSSASESSSSSFEVPSTASQSSRSPSTSLVLKHQNSISSINSCTLRDVSTHSISEEFDAFVPSEKIISSKGKLNTMSLKSTLSGIDEDTNKPTSPKRQKKTAVRRTPQQRKHGTEASPFVYNRHGTLTFRKPDVEKLKREKREKRKSAIRGSLGKFLLEDDDEDDILAGILSGR